MIRDLLLCVRVRPMRTLNHRSSSILLGGLVLVAALVAAPRAAHAAHGTEHGIGVGVTQTLAGVSGATFVYDASAFHIVGLLGFESVNRADDTTRLALGGQFLFHLSTSAQSDFSIGPGLTIQRHTTDGPGGDETNVDIEILAQIRAFIVPNVALSASLGFLVVTVDNNSLAGGITSGGGGNTVAFGGQVLGALGITYFF